MTCVSVTFDLRDETARVALRAYLAAAQRRGETLTDELAACQAELDRLDRERVDEKHPPLFRTV